MERADSIRQRAVSQDTVASLQRLDPSPIESTENLLETEDTASSMKESVDHAINSASSTLGEAPSGITSALGLSGGGHGAIYNLVQIQRYSSYAMSIFTSLHLANVSLIPAATRSVPGSETYLLMTREIYQTTLAEPIVVFAPVVAHVGSGVALRLIRRWKKANRYGGAKPGAALLHRDPRAASLWPPLSYISISGYAFSIFYGAHVFMNRLLPLAVEGDSSNIGLAYVAHGFARHPLVAGLAYTGLIVVGCGHMVWGSAKWLGMAPTTRGIGLAEREAGETEKRARRARRRRWTALHGVVVLASAAWMSGGMGVVSKGGLADGWVGKLYDELFGRVWL